MLKINRSHLTDKHEGSSIEAMFSNRHRVTSEDTLMGERAIVIDRPKPGLFLQVLLFLKGCEKRELPREWEYNEEMREEFEYWGIQMQEVDNDS